MKMLTPAAPLATPIVNRIESPGMKKPTKSPVSEKTIREKSRAARAELPSRILHVFEKALCVKEIHCRKSMMSCIRSSARPRQPRVV